MTVIGFTKEEIRWVLEVTAVVLKLGNVELVGEFQANGLSASGISNGKGPYHSAGPPLPHCSIWHLESPAVSVLPPSAEFVHSTLSVFLEHTY